MIKKAYIYSDYGSSQFCVESLTHCFKAIYEEDNIEIDQITAEQILNRELFENEAGKIEINEKLLCFGGGFDMGYVEILGKQGVDVIKEFVQLGGNYLGICAGAYFATDYIQFDLGGPLEVLGL